jgi:hypothetical protein
MKFDKNLFCAAFTLTLCSFMGVAHAAGIPPNANICIVDVTLLIADNSVETQYSCDGSAATKLAPISTTADQSVIQESTGQVNKFLMLGMKISSRNTQGTLNEYVLTH